ncbi:MAG: hypothetical protein QM733_09795 [Ilumatobacteraceae bacterium]
MAQQPRPGRVVDPPGEHHPLGQLGADAVDRRVDRRAVVAVGAGDHQQYVRLLGGQPGERLDQRRQVLAPLQRADREHVRATVELGDRRHATGR